MAYIIAYNVFVFQFSNLQFEFHVTNSIWIKAKVEIHIQGAQMGLFRKK